MIENESQNILPSDVAYGGPTEHVNSSFNDQKGAKFS